MESSETATRDRLLIALGAALALTAAIVIVAITSGGDSEGPGFVSAPKRCIDAWNDDEAALAYGRHNFSFHLYEGARVTFLSETGEEVGEGQGGLCAVIFPSEALDPEPFAAGQVLRKDLWFPVSELEEIELNRLAELQVLAAGSPNTTLDTQGELSEL